MRSSDWSSDVCSSDLASGTDSRRIGGFNQQSELVDVAGLPGSRCTHQEIPEDVVFPADPDRRAVGVIGDELGRPVGVQSPGRSLGRADQFKPTRVREYQRTGQAELASGYVEDRKSTRLNSSH